MSYWPRHRAPVTPSDVLRARSIRDGLRALKRPVPPTFTHLASLEPWEQARVEDILAARAVVSWARSNGNVPAEEDIATAALPLPPQVEVEVVDYQEAIAAGWNPARA